MKKIIFVILGLFMLSTSIAISAGSDSSDQVVKPSSYNKAVKLIKKELLTIEFNDMELSDIDEQDKKEFNIEY